MTVRMTVPRCEADMSSDSLTSDLTPQVFNELCVRRGVQTCVAEGNTSDDPAVVRWLQCFAMDEPAEFQVVQIYKVISSHESSCAHLLTHANLLEWVVLT